MLKKLKSIPSLAYTKTHRCWYIDYNNSSYHQLLATNIPINIIDKKTDTTIEAISESDNISIPKNNSEGFSVLPKDGIKATDISNTHLKKLSIEWNNRHFLISTRYKKRDIDFIKELNASWWNNKHQKWITKGNVSNLEKLQSYFSYWSIDEYDRLYNLIAKTDHPAIIELYISPEFSDKILIKLSGYGIDFNFIKQLSERSYDKIYKRWIIPYNHKLINRLISYYKEKGVKIVNRIPSSKGHYLKPKLSIKQRQNHLLSKWSCVSREILLVYTDTMIQQKYSWRTISTYTREFGKMLSFFHPLEPNILIAKDINRYIRQLINMNTSESHINKVVSAIKFYYTKVAFIPHFEIERVKRPRRYKHLPTILSIHEVDAMLRSTQNLKHICLLYTLYGGGMRVNEVLELRVQDILWDRNQIFIRRAKGKKDRVIMLSDTLKSVLGLYIDTYKPMYWLFEGKDKKTSYSSSSIQKLVKRAAQKVGIRRRVTPHTLRHCFATHLLDQGTDVRYIQELLGHKNVNTTMIYTHVTKSMSTNITSPLDRLSMKNSKKAE